MATKYSRACAFCHEVPAKSKCARCEATYYCSKECQVGHWKTHKPYCNLAKDKGYGKEIKDVKHQVQDDTGMSKEKRLLKASIAGLNAIVRSLIAEGVNVNYQDKDGQTSLFDACALGFLDVVKELIAARADVNIARMDRSTPLIVASIAGHCEVVLALLNAGANVNHVRRDGFDALILASQYGHVEVVRLLLTHGANVNHLNNNGTDALIMASGNGHVEVVRLLLAHGANRIASALAIAKHQGHNAIVEILTTLL